MKYIKRYEESQNIDHILVDIDDIFIDIEESGLMITKQLQGNELLMYITCNILKEGKSRFFYWDDIKNEVYHFISQMSEYGHKLLRVRYRHQSYWDNIWTIGDISPIFDIFDEVRSSDKIESFEMRFKL